MAVEDAFARLQVCNHWFLEQEPVITYADEQRARIHLPDLNASNLSVSGESNRSGFFFFQKGAYAPVYEALSSSQSSSWCS